MNANGKKATTEELLNRVWNAIERSRDYLNEFRRQQDALEERQDKWERDHPGWQIHECSLITRFPR